MVKANIVEQSVTQEVKQAQDAQEMQGEYAVQEGDAVVVEEGASEELVTQEDVVAIEKNGI